jgi:hypothetical protein
VLSNVHLAYRKHIHFDGQYLHTAQLDHAVVGPTGVFVIETKSWSADFVQKEQFFSPYSQVCRAGYLCYRLLREECVECRVRNIIATDGSLPPKPARMYVRVLQPRGLSRYVGTQKAVLNSAQVEIIARYLSRSIL